jgi:hypothetical protein
VLGTELRALHLDTVSSPHFKLARGPGCKQQRNLKPGELERILLKGPRVAHRNTGTTMETATLRPLW